MSYLWASGGAAVHPNLTSSREKKLLSCTGEALGNTSRFYCWLSENAAKSCQ